MEHANTFMLTTSTTTQPVAFGRTFTGADYKTF